MTGRHPATGRRTAAAPLAAAVAALCLAGGPASARAQPTEERAAPDSPAGIEYAAPLERARELAAPPAARSRGDARAVVGAPAFGIGVEPQGGSTGGPAAGPSSGSSAGAPADRQAGADGPGRSSRASADAAAASPDGGDDGSSAQPLAVAAAVLLAGILLGLLIARLPARRVAPALAVALAAGCGTAPAWHGLYPLSTWGPIALVLATALVALVVARRMPLPSRAGLIALGGVALLWIWAALSTRWAESVDQALVDSGRWLLYAVLLALLLAVVREGRTSRLVVWAAAAAVVAFGAYLCVRLSLPGSAELFLGGRLSYPLGYVNGQAGYLMLAVWPALAVAETARRPLVGGAALAVAVTLSGLILLSQARAVTLAALAAAVLLLAVVPGRGRRLACLLTLGLGVAIAAGPLLDVYGATSPGDRRIDEAALRAAVLSLCGAALIAGAVWGSLCALVTRAPQPTRDRLRAATGPVVAIACLALALGLVVATGNPVEQARAGVREFKRLDVDSARESQSRFASGGGNRYDYWRIAADQFREHPLIGVGAGNYDRTYFAERRTDEDVRQPHSLPLQSLAELGAIGLVGVALLVAGAALGLARRARLAAGDRSERLLAVAAGGTFAAWLVHTSVDWLHLIPGVTGIALCSLAALVAGRPAADGHWAAEGPGGRSPAAPDGRGERRGVPGGRVAFAVACVATATLGSALIAGPLLADRHRADGQRLLADDPVAALREADAALRLDDESLAAYRLRAAAQARLGDYAAARASLLAAADRKPHDFVTWALLGDLARRRGAGGQARAAYVRAARLNPRDRGLAALARAAGGGQRRVTTAN